MKKYLLVLFIALAGSIHYSHAQIKFYENEADSASLATTFGSCITIDMLEDHILDTLCLQSIQDTFRIRYIPRAQADWRYIKYLKNVHTIMMDMQDLSNYSVDAYQLFDLLPDNIVNLEFSFKDFQFGVKHIPAHVEHLKIDLGDAGYLGGDIIPFPEIPENSRLKSLYLKYMVDLDAIYDTNKLNLPEGMTEFTFISNNYINSGGDDDWEPEFIGKRDFIEKFPASLKEIHVETLLLPFTKDIFSTCTSLEKLHYRYSTYWFYRTEYDEIFDYEFTLPTSLNELRLIHDGHATRDISNLPSGLQKADILGLKISNPSEFIFPAGLKELSWTSSELTEIPPLPQQLQKIDLSKNYLQQTGKLPNNLLYLNLGDNQLKCIPKLPYSLRTLYIPPGRCIPNETYGVKADSYFKLCTDQTQICDFDSNAVAKAKGRVYIDLNGNGAADTSDYFVSSVILESTPGPYYSGTNHTGSYTAYLDTNSSGTIRPFSENIPHFEGFVPEFYAVNTTSNIYLGDTFDFKLNLTPNITDAEVKMVTGAMRPGFDGYAAITLKNQGTTTLKTDLKLVMPAGLSIEYAEPAYSRIVNDTIFWEDVELGLLKNGLFAVEFKIPASAVLGSVMTYQAIADTEQDDIVPENNTFTLDVTVMGSYDPNDKKAIPEQITPGYPADQEIVYTIRFQNTGTDTAFNITVTDTIRKPLKLSGIRLIGASHPYEYSFRGDSIVEFYFPDILLPDSNKDERGSHGFVMFGLRPEHGLPEGSLLTNRAGIYFDFNAPIITEYATTSVKTVTSINDIASSGQKILIYPNPATDLLQIRTEHPVSGILNIYDLQGRSVYSKRMAEGEQALHIGQLSPGMYILVFNGKDIYYSAKLIVED